MDSDLLIRAIEKAILGGAVSAPPMDVLGDDVSYVRTQTDVGIEPAILDSFISDLRSDPDMAAFDGMFANTPIGGGVSVDLPSVARLLLARAIATNDVTGTVGQFRNFLANNAASATAVMTISGIKVANPVKLGPNVSLVPITALPPSAQRGMALGQSPYGRSEIHSAARSALVTQFLYGPVFYTPKNPQPLEEMGASIPTNAARATLEEAFNLMSVLSIHPRFRMFWAQPDDWLMSFGMGDGWQRSAFDERLNYETEVPETAIEALSAAYFALDPQKRTKMLRIPLDRLGRAGREQDWADRAIDLGIALESLLLHDIKDRGELNFRLSLRGAWLIGADSVERLEIQRSLKELYGLRSQAVHSGFVEWNKINKTTIDRATEICGSVIRRIIDLKCVVDWGKIVVGG
jgi:hypothetical protein